MPTYIILGKFTEHGIKDIKLAPEWFKIAKERLKSIKVELKEIYFTMGRYDFIVIGDAPSVDAAMFGLLATGATGRISTETLTAIPMDQIEKIIEKLP